MDRTLFDKKGIAIAYICDDYHGTIFLWDGSPVAYVHDDRYIYGINGRHLGWFINEIIYNNNGERTGFTYGSCPVAPAKEITKTEKYPRDEIRPRWAAPPLPNLTFNFADQDFADFLKEGEVDRAYPEELSEKLPDE